MKKLIWLVLPLALLALLAGSALAAGGTGTGDALLPIGQTQTVAPHSAQWYRFDYGGNGSQITASVTDNGASGIRLIPPLMISPALADEGVDILRDALRESVAGA